MATGIWKSGQCGSTPVSSLRGFTGRVGRTSTLAIGLGLFAALTAMTAGRAWSGAAGYSSTVLTDDRDHPAAKSIFTPATPKIFVVFTLSDVSAGTSLKAVWIAEKTAVAPPNYQIDVAELSGGGLLNSGSFSISRPNKGWPEGTYRVELYLQGKRARTLRFRVEAHTASARGGGR